MFDNSPCRNSLLISKVTKKKNIAIKASLIQCKTESFKPKLLIPTNKYLFNVEKYKSEKLELLIISAIIAENNKTNPLEASSLKNHLNGEEIYFNINYFIKSLKNKYTSISDSYKFFKISSMLGII